MDPNDRLEFELIEAYVASYLGDLSTQSTSISSRGWKYLDGGEGPTILFLHGLMSSKIQWRSLMHLYTNVYHTVAPDIPGLAHDVTFQDRKHSARNLANWFDEFLVSLNIEHCHIVSSGTSCPLAAYYAATRPEQVDSIAFIGFPDLLGTRASDDGAVQRWLQKLREIKTIEDFDAYSGQIFYRKLNFPNFIQRFNLQLFKQRRDAVLAVTQELVDSQPLLMAHLSKVKCPTLSISGDKDYFASPSFPERLKVHIPTLKHFTLSQCGHLCYMEKRHEVERLHKLFLKDL